MSEDGGNGWRSFGAVHLAKEKESISISFDPSTGRVPATRGGIGSQDTCANERNPAQARILNPAPTPRKRKEQKENFWLCGYVQWLPVDTV